MTTLQLCIELLDRKRISYTRTTHANAYRAREVASAEYLPAYMLAKTVIFCGDGCSGMAWRAAACPRWSARTALHHNADLVVIGRGKVRETFGRLRTNAYAIIRDSPCPALSV